MVHMHVHAHVHVCVRVRNAHAPCDSHVSAHASRYSSSAMPDRRVSTAIATSLMLKSFTGVTALLPPPCPALPRRRPGGTMCSPSLNMRRRSVFICLNERRLCTTHSMTLSRMQNSCVRLNFAQLRIHTIRISHPRRAKSNTVYMRVRWAAARSGSQQSRRMWRHRAPTTGATRPCWRRQQGATLMRER